MNLTIPFRDTPDTLASLRALFDLTQKQAADRVYTTLRTWQSWEQGERRMPRGYQLLLLYRLRLHPDTAPSAAFSPQRGRRRRPAKSS